LTYSDYLIATAEGFSRIDFNNGWFVKGYAALGAFFGGQLKDEDFPPAINPYSATLSLQKYGSMVYLSTDVGADIVRGPDFRVGAFVGYHFLRETLSAYGCGQIAFNPMVCAGGIPDFVRGITQVNNWNSLRLGLNGTVEFNNRLKFNLDVAWLPFSISRGPTPIGCAWGPGSATSTVESPRRAPAGVIRSTLFSPIASLMCSALASAPAIGICRRAARRTSRAASTASSPTRSR
jgi:hypothetical protein